MIDVKAHGAGADKKAHIKQLIRDVAHYMPILITIH